MIEFRECEQPGCRFRYPVMAGEHWRGRHCPRCGGPARQVESVTPSQSEGSRSAQFHRLPVEGLLDNVRSVFNVGSIFRSADGAGLRRLTLCGITPTPEHRKLAKTALGAEQAVAWEYHTNGVNAAMALRRLGHPLWCIEEGELSHSLFDCRPPVDGQALILVVGHELAGVDPGIRRLADAVVAIPMAGVKRSLNVAVAFAVAAYFVAAAARQPAS